MAVKLYFMQRRWQPVFQWIVLLLFLGTIGTAFGYWMTSQPLFRNTAVSPQPVIWNSLPTPVTIKPQWQSFTHSETINDLLIVDNILWVGTDGGLLGHALATGKIVKFTTEHGLASNRVTSLAVGIDRSLWIGTASGGVSNFNGRSWQTFTLDDGLSSNQINDLTVTSDGAVWIGTPEGLDRYDGNRWTNFNSVNTLFALRSQNIRQVTAVPGTDQVWAATNRGLTYFDGRRWETVGFGNSNLGSDNVFTLDMTADGALWVGHQAGLQRFQNGQWDKFTPIDGLFDPEVHWLTAVSSTEVWLGYRDDIQAISHLTVHNGVGTFSHLDTAVHFDENQIQTMLIAGQLKMVGSTDGLYQDKGAGWQRSVQPSEIPSHEINSLIGTRGTVWSSGPFGVGRFDNSEWHFFDTTDGLISQEVTQLAIGPDQTPYAVYGVAGMGLSQFRTNGRWETIACPVYAPQSLNIYDGLQDQSGNYWFSSDRGLAYFDQTQWQIYTPFHGLPEGSIWDIEEAPDGTLWVAGQLGFANQVGTQWQIIPADDVQQITIAPDGTVWGLTLEEIVQIQENKIVPISAIPSPHIGTIDATVDALWLATADGVARLDSQQRSWRTYTVAEGLPFNRTPIIFVDEQEQVWAVSESGPRDPANGYFIPYNFNLRYVSRLENDSWESTLIANKHQPIHGIIMDIIVGPNDALWVSTLAGVSQYDGTVWRSYTMANGLPAPEVYKLTVAFDSIWAVTQNGVVQLIMDDNEDITAVNRLTWDGSAFLRLDIETAPDGTVWASNGISLYQFDGRQWREIGIDQSLGISRLDSFTFDNNGRLWGAMSLQGELLEDAQRIFLGWFENGVWQWDPVHSDSLPQPNSLNEIAFAPDGRLWAGGTNGISVFDAQQANFGKTVTGFRTPIEQITDIAFKPDGTTLLTSRFENQFITIKNNEFEFIPLPIVEASGAHSIVVDDAGSIWIGSNQGVAKLSGSAWETFQAAAFNVEGGSTWLSVLDSEKYWFGTSRGQLISYDSGELTQLPLFTDTRSTERPFTITAVFPQANGTVLIGSILGGVAQFEGQDWHRFGSSASLYDGQLQSIAFQGSTAWLGTSDGIVTRDVFSQVACSTVPELPWDDTQVVLTAVDETLWFLGGQVVYWLEDEKLGRGGYQALPVGAVGGDGSVWFATINGLMRHGNGRTRDLITELPTAAQINSLAVDANNQLWMGTNDGLFIFAQRKWQRVASQDGLADNHVTQITFAADGSIWFATKGGLSRYQP